MADLDQLSINTMRTLAIDAVQKANSGHPGTPMALAPAAYTLWQKRLRFDPADPIWPNRDRFVLSVGHASMLLWTLLHLTGVRAVDAEYEQLDQPSVTLDDIKRFRQLGSKCPGHPEYHLTSGVEATTGPLGQGVAMSVGMAIAREWMAQHFNRPSYPMFDYDIYALCSDGDMMEGISGEAASLAGHLKLEHFCWIYDRNRVSIEGSTELTFTEDVPARFLAYGWSVLFVQNANDTTAIEQALIRFSETSGQPTLIVIDSHIGYGSPHKQDSAAAHGEPLGVDEVKLVKRAYGWPEDAQFFIPDGVYEHFRKGIGERGDRLRADWVDMLGRYRQDYPELAEALDQMQTRELPAGWDVDIPSFPANAEGVASRDSSGKVENAIAARVPWLIGGSADLAPSTKTRLTLKDDFEPESYIGRNFHFGVREHAMGAVCNGMALSKLRPFGSSFLIFSDYMRAAIRLSAIMEVPVIYIFTHDSIGVGEDGPTHQPVEQLASLRAIPGLLTIRPCDANEVAEAWRVVMAQKHQPACLVLSRQKLPTLDRSQLSSARGLERGAYILSDSPDRNPDVILIGTGSEVSLCVSAADQLAIEGIKARVVSMPSWHLFELQDPAYRAKVLPPEIKARVSVEQAATIGWERYVGTSGAMIGMHTFGASAPLKALQTKFGFTPDRVTEVARDQVRQAREATALSPAGA